MPLPPELFMFFAYKGIMPEGGSESEQVASIQRHWKEMERKHSNQAGFIREFQRCLDGIKEIQCIPGSSSEGCHDAQSIRSIVKTLVANSPSCIISSLTKQPMRVCTGVMMKDGRASFQVQNKTGELVQYKVTIEKV